MTALSPPKHPADPARLPTRRRSIVAQAFRYLGALAVLATGLAHIEQSSVDNYSTVPTIVVALTVEVAATIFLVAFLLANGTGLQKIPTSAR